MYEVISLRPIVIQTEPNLISLFSNLIHFSLYSKMFVCAMFLYSILLLLQINVIIILCL